MTGGDYRDELAAAHARIAELEQQVAELQAGGGGAAPWLAELEAKRAVVIAEGKKGLGDPRRRWKTWGIIFGVLMTFAAAIAVVTGSLIPFLPLFFLSLHPGLLVIWAIGSSRAQRAKKELAKIDEKIGDVKRMAQIMGATRVNVEPRARVAVTGDLDLDGEELDANQAARTRRG